MTCKCALYNNICHFAVTNRCAVEDTLWKCVLDSYAQKEDSGISSFVVLCSFIRNSCSKPRGNFWIAVTVKEFKEECCNAPAFIVRVACLK